MSDREKGTASRKKRKRPARKRTIAAVLVLAVAVIAVAVFLRLQGRIDPSELIAEAEQQFAAGDFSSAIINLKNVVSRDKTDAGARFLLGRAYLESGNPAAALKELEKAREMGERSVEVDLGIVQSMIVTGKFDEAATEIAIYGDTTKPKWLILRGMLDLAQQRLEDARVAFKDVLAEDPENEQARRGLMRAELSAGNAALARSEVETLLISKSSDPELWIIKGELDLYEKNAEAARDSFQRALDLSPQNPMAHMGIARAFLILGELDLASNHLDETGKREAVDPRVNFLRARIADERGDHNSALRELRRVLQVAPMHRESLVMAAKVHFTQGEFTRAQDYVSRLLEIEPNNAAARRMIGAIQLASGRLDGLEEIGKAARSGESIQDPGLLALLGTAYLKHGKFEDSQDSLERAAELAPDSVPIRTQLALSKISSGKIEEAISDLEAIIEETPDFVQADIMLALAYVAQQKPDKALAVTQGLLAKRPESALGQNVHGYILELSGDLDGAAQAYDTALSYDQNFHPARINLARLAVNAGDLELAAKRFQEVLNIETFHPFALMGLAALALQDGDLDEAERLWQLAREHNPDAVAPRLLLAKHYRARNSLTLAETLVKEAYRLAPFAVQVQAEYASIMLQIRSFDEALQAARALTARIPDSLQGLELLANIYNQLGDEQGLTETLKRIARAAPDNVGAKILLGRLAIRRKDFDAARSIVESLLLSKENAAAGHELQGDMHAAQKELEHAIEAYARAHEMVPTSANVMKLDGVERASGRGGDRLVRWLDKHPDDFQVRLVHASYLQQRGAGSDAIPEYERMLQAQGKNPVVLNNLAWLYHEAEDDRALDLARRAHELAPGQPEIMDTYGWILFSQEQHEQGLDLLRKALEIAPDNPDIAYHLASALSDSGQSNAARKQLQAILSQHEEFSFRKEAESLLARIDDE